MVCRYLNLVSVFTILLSKNKIKYRINIQTDFCKILLENRLMKFFCKQIRIQRVEKLTFLSYSLLQLFFPLSLYRTSHQLFIIPVGWTGMFPFILCPVKCSSLSLSREKHCPLMWSKKAEQVKELVREYK